MGQHKPRAEWTEAARQRERKTRRARFHKRYRHDAAFRADFLAKKKEWLDKKCQRCPEYARLAYLRTTVGRLREQIEKHEAEVAAEMTRLIGLQKEMEALAKQCRGK